MKLSAALRLTARPALLLLVWLALTGCATSKINWADRVGHYTFDQAVLEMGPPDKQARLDDGTIVADWQTQRGYTQIQPMPYYGYRTRAYGAAYGAPVVYSAPDVFLRLTFAPDGQLLNWKKVMN